MAWRRIQSGLSNVHSHVSNNLVMLQDAWSGDHMDFQARLLGQSTTGVVDVTDDQVRLEVQLPWVLAMVANKAKALVKRQGQLMLEDPKSKR